MLDLTESFIPEYHYLVTIIAKKSNHYAVIKAKQTKQCNPSMSCVPHPSPNIERAPSASCYRLISSLRDRAFVVSSCRLFLR